MIKMFKIIKKLCLTMLLLLCFSTVTFATETNVNVAPQYTDVKECFQTFSIPVEKLFYLTLAAINHSRFKPIETMTREGYILFKVGNKEFLASISEVNDKVSMIKIAPTDNSYYFSRSIPKTIFVYIWNNHTIEPEVLVQEK